MRAFALMRQPEALEAIFVRSPFYDRNRFGLDEIRSALHCDFARRYRGIGRFPSTEFPVRGPGWQGEDAKYDDVELQARALLLAALGSDDNATPYPRAFIRDRRDAATVHAALTSAADYEMVELCTPPESPSEPLGFDVGYWGGGNFSILCDTAVWPIWHPPVPAAFPELACRVAELNQHGLFPTADAAKAFASWYSSQDWAEQEPSDFTVIAVGRIGNDAG